MEEECKEIQKNEPVMIRFFHFYDGSPTWIRTKVKGFGDLYTDHCAMGLE